MTLPDSLIEPQAEQATGETDLLLKILAVGEAEIKNGRFRCAKIVFQELDTISDSSDA